MSFNNFKLRYKDTTSTEEPVVVSTVIHMSLDSWKYNRPIRTFGNDEFEAFILLGIINVQNPQLWWIQHRQDYPQLAGMALDILAILALSSEIERVFSSLGLLLTDRRNRLKGSVVEAAECLKSWNKKSFCGFSRYKDIAKVEEMLDSLYKKNNIA